MKTTLSDRVLWYKSWHDDIQDKASSKKAQLSATTVANRMQKTSSEVPELGLSFFFV